MCLIRISDILAGPILQETICRDKFGGKPIWQENKWKCFTFASIEATAKKFCYVTKAIEKAIVIVQLIILF